MLHTRIFQFNPLGTNCAVIWADGSPLCTVADPGMCSDEGEQELLAYLSREGLTPCAILLTHGHFDHVWGVERLLARFSVPVYMHPADKPLVANGALGFRGMETMKMMQHHFSTVDIADGDVLTTGGVSWQVLTTPGHTPGGVCFYCADDNLLLSGDTLFAGSIGRTDLPGGDYDLLMASIKDKLLNLPGTTDVIPGHGQPTTIAREGMYNPFLEPFNEPNEE